MKPQHFTYHIRQGEHRSRSFEHEGPFEGALRKARRLAALHSTTKGVELVIRNARTGEEVIIPL